MAENATALSPAASDACLHSWVECSGGRLRRCTACDLVATSRAPAFEYVREYFTNSASGGYDFDAEFAIDYDRARFEAELQRLEAQELHGSLLDVGCATGNYMKAAVRRGWKVTGVETAEFARHIAARRTSALVVGSCAELPRNARYDVVTLHHVLEHLHDPGTFLRETLAPRVGRRLLIEVPNFDSLASRVYGSRWRDLRLEQHVSHFTGRTLAHTVDSAGFRVLRVYTLWQPLWSLRASLELAQLVVGGFRGLDRRWRPAETNGGRAAEDEKRAYRRATGVRRLMVRTTELASRPLVRALERSGDGDRLVIEAEPEDSR